MEPMILVVGVVAVVLVVLGIFIPEVWEVLGDIIEAAGTVVGILLALLCCGGCLAVGAMIASGFD